MTDIKKLLRRGCKTLAPLAGYSDVAFRRLCRDFGADLAVTEMVSVAGLNYRGKKTILRNIALLEEETLDGK